MDPTPRPLLVYGAYGYTGTLIAREAIRRGLPVILGGRDSERLARLAAELGCPWRAFPLLDAVALRRAIEDVSAVVHCAGPFHTTWQPMAEACLDTRVHYLDITGEIPVFQGVSKMGAHAERAGVMLLPGAGFDVVPTDCLAAHLAQKLPDAVRLVLAFQGLGHLSIGTARTMTTPISGLQVPKGSGPATRRIDFGDGPVRALSIPWGDVYTARHTTGVQDVTVYTAQPLHRQLLAGLAMGAAFTFRHPAVQEAAARALAGGTGGPDAATRAASRSRIAGEAVAGDGRRVEARLLGPDGYTLTALAVAGDRGARPGRAGAPGLADAGRGLRRGPGALVAGRDPHGRGPRLSRARRAVPRVCILPGRLTCANRSPSCSSPPLAASCSPAGSPGAAR
ncbi:MAG: saccharopine dehydrogenase NADP-binding domain-containing protein [Anaeromyxobacter sp.]